jgi:hypothetical protein
MESIHERMAAITHYSQIDLSHNRLRRADFVLAKRDGLARRLVMHFREAIETIETVVLQRRLCSSA